MQFFSNSSDYYIKSIRTVLKCCRRTAALSIITHGELAELDDLHVLGDIVAFIGKLTADDCPHLLVVLDAQLVGEIGPSDESVFRIGRTLAVPVIDNGQSKPNYFDTSSNGFGKLKSQQRKFLSFMTNRTLHSVQLIDDVVKMLNDLETFYYCTSLDLTLNTQRRAENPDRSIDEFFWNRHLLDDFFDSESKMRPECSEWVCRIIHGYFDQRHLSYETDSQLRLTLISRRSTQRAGVRYLRRGVDDGGHVANFVESEMIVRIFGHTLSYVQIRGSVPLFWSQKGYRYRPPLVIDKTLSESLPACRQHLEKVKGEYGVPLAIVNLVDQSGRELALGEAFLQHVLEIDDADVNYYAFDFHDQCRALRFDRVSVLLDALAEDLQRIGFCWIDKGGEMVREQRGIVRTNCVDCLDRTNVVQSAISQLVCASQSRKLGLIEPFEETPEVLVQVLQGMWADHGDCISRQYAGTSALKGDITRGGRRKFLTGYVKDGYNSATRYIVSHIRDAQRQRAIEALTSGKGATLIKPPTEQEELEIAQEAASNSDPYSDEESDPEEEEVENIGRLVHETARFVLPANEVLVGGWALVDGANRSGHVDTVLLLTRTQILVASYADEETEKLLELREIPFKSVDQIEVGTLGKSQRQHLRIYWTQPGDKTTSTSSSCYCSWRAAKTRLFNNVAIALKDGTEADEYVLAIAEQLRITTTMSGVPIDVNRVEKLSGSSANKESGRRSLVASLNAKLKLTTAQLRGEEPKAGGVPHSRSEGLLANAAATSSGLISKLQSKFKVPLSGKRLPVSTSNTTLAVPVQPPTIIEPNEAVTPADTQPPLAGRFDSYRQGVLKSKSQIVLL